MGFIRGLAKLGLVTLTEEEEREQREREAGERATEGAVPSPVKTAAEELAELDRQLAAAGASTSAAATTASPTSTVQASVESDIPEGLDLQDIYASSNITAGVFSYERFVDVVNKMSAKNMTPSQQLQTIEVMDLTDDTWSLQDVAKEARAKRNALLDYQEMLRATIASMEQDATRRKQELQQQSDADIADLRAQIEALQQRIQATMLSTNEALNAVSDRLANNRLAAERETNRIQEHIVVMQQLDGIFFKSIPVESSTATTNQ